MTNLSTLITQLEAAAREATPDTVDSIVKGALNGAGKQIWHMRGAPAFEEQAKRDVEYYALANPATILQLTQALREAVEILEHFSPGWKVTSLNETVPFTGHGSDPVRQQWRRYVTPQTEQARAFLARWKGEGT